LGLWVGLCWCLVGSSLAWAQSSDRPPLVAVRALGPVAPEYLRMACRNLLETYPVRCEVRSPHAWQDVSSAWNERRDQLDARVTLENFFRNRLGDDAVVELTITNWDIYEDRKPFVFGLASLTDRVAIVSLHRIDGSSSRIAARLGKLVRHEVGHAFGLHHHADETCVMRQDPTVASLDTAPTALCTACHTRLEQQANALGQPGQIALDRARGHLVRGETEAAREELVRTLWAGHRDPDLLDAFAVAFFEAEHFNEAISVLTFVAEQYPTRPRTRANLGLAYQMRGDQGDIARAIEQFHEALKLRPRWVLVQMHLDSLMHATPARAQGPANEPD